QLLVGDGARQRLVGRGRAGSDLARAVRAHEPAHHGIAREVTARGGRHRRSDSVIGATSTKQVLNGAAPAGDARSAISTFEQPRVSCAVASGVNHAPSLIEMTPRAMRSVTRAGSTVEPRSLKTRTRWPSAIPRGAASAGWIHTSSRSARLRIGWLSWIEW